MLDHANWIFVSMENWDDVWRRNQFLCAELVRRHPDLRILFVGLARDVSNSLRRGRVSDLQRPAVQVVPDLPNVTVLNPLKLLPNSLAAGRRLNEALLRWQVRTAAATLGMERPLLWLNPHYAVHMVGRMGESAVVYDITDDWISLSQSERLRRLTRQQDEELCRKADAVIVCSEKLYELKRPLARNLHLIPNGVDAAHYRRVLDGTGPWPEAASAWKRPVLGYTGSIHPDRVDVDLVEEIARRFTQGTIALVGPNMLPTVDRERLNAHPNVVLTGPVPYAQVPDYMRAFDVCITPHRVTPFTESLNPIKLWEYLAAGKPIVSTDVAGFRDYPQFVRIARSAEEFVDQAHAALQETRGAMEERRREAARHSWISRVNAVEEVIAGCVDAREGDAAVAR